MKSLRLFILVLCVAAGGSQATEFHVAPNGNDANPGTSANRLRRWSVRAMEPANPKFKIRNSKSMSLFMAARMSWRDRSN